MTIEELAEASSHPYDCRCSLCLEWWRELGPDGGEEGNYGPFDADEVEGEIS